MSRLDTSLPGLILLPVAKADLREIFLYLGRNSEPRAQKFAESAGQTFEQLIELPNIGSPRFFSHPQLHGLRQWPIQNFRDYLIFYRPFASANGLEVLRVLHASRDIQTHLESTLDEPSPPSIGDGE